MHIYTANVREVENNTNYPNASEIRGLKDLKAAVRFDHVAGEMKDRKRAKENFQRADCIMLDCDNSHSEDPDDWVTLDDVSDALPDVCFYYIRSRNYMKEKTKTARDGTVTRYAPREKFHLYFPLAGFVDAEKYTQIILTACGAFPFFDLAAVDTAHFFYGVEQPEGGYVDGDLMLDAFTIGKDEIRKNVEEYEEHGFAKGKEFKKLLRFAGIEEEQRKAEPPDVSWISERERERAASWFLNWARVHHVEILDRYEIDTVDHPRAFVFCVPCPWESEHSMKGPKNETVVIVEASGKLNFLCRHGHDYDWHDYRAKIEAAGRPSRWISFSDVDTRAVEWLIPGYVPRKGVTVLGSDGGVGKGTVSCSIIADISAGRETFLTRGSSLEIPFKCEPGRIIWLNAEDPYREVLKPMLEANDADMANILAMDEREILESGVCFSDEALKADIKAFSPDLVVFDPLQAFLPGTVKMAERNLMRREVGHAMALAKECGCAVLIVMHTNKSRGSFGRNRLADSADMWDISRSVLMLGVNEIDSSLRYLSQEKSSFSMLQDSINFRIGRDRTVEVVDRDQKRDREHVLAASRLDAKRDDQKPAKDQAKELIIKILTDAADNEVETGELKAELKEVHGIGTNALETAKSELRAEGRIGYRREGKKQYFIRLLP